jgi:hypothetical protein
LRNSGQTPGYKFTTWIKEPKILAPDAVPFADATPISDRNGSSIIGPGADVWLQWIMPSTPELSAEVEAGKKNVFVWGGADFIDAFDKPRYFIFRDINSAGAFGLAGNRLGVKPHKLGYDAN